MCLRAFVEAGAILLSLVEQRTKPVEGHTCALRDGRQRLLRALTTDNNSPALAKAPSTPLGAFCIYAAQSTTLFVDFHSKLHWVDETNEQRGGHLRVRMLRPVPQGRFGG